MLWDAGLYADADLSDSTLPKKVRNGEIAQYNYIFGAYSDCCPQFQLDQLTSKLSLYSRRK